MDTLKLITQKISKKKCYQTEVQILEKSENMSINDQKYIVNQIELASLKHPHEMKEFSKLIEENFNYKWRNSRWKVVIHKGHLHYNFHLSIHVSVRPSHFCGS